MNINLKIFQLDAIKSLLRMMNDDVTEIVLKSPTGSGKTVILTQFMNSYLELNPKTVFIWLTPGKGKLEEQSKNKMDLYIPNSHTKLLQDVMILGFEENDCCFINWEKVNSVGSKAFECNEKYNLKDHINNALLKGLNFKIIIDESHENFTEKSDTIIQYFKTDKIIRCSATPIIHKNAKVIDINEKDVISEGLIKKMLIINEDLEDEIKTDNATNYLLSKALNKQKLLATEFNKYKLDVNPLIVIQLPNKSETLLYDVENYLDSKGLTYENGRLAIWLSNRHENLENIYNKNSNVDAVIIKQAIATGWDCPRAHILVKLRENMDETFEIQTIGRIRRMPEAKHYNNSLLDNCYLYTFDQKFVDGVKLSLGKNALDAKTIFLKNEHKSYRLFKEQRTSLLEGKDDRKACECIANFIKEKYGLTNNKKENKIILSENKFKFLNHIERDTITGHITSLNEFSDNKNFDKIKFYETLNTHIHGREYQKIVTKLASDISLTYPTTRSILLKLFSEKFSYAIKLLSLNTPDLYAFVINNQRILNELFYNAMAKPFKQLSAKLEMVIEKDFLIPRECLFTYDSKNKLQIPMNKNVYQNYLSSAEARSSSEKKFEKFCENNPCVDWIYKNGDKGEEFLSIVYLDNADTQRLFYPDYVLSVKGETWIIETKGGFTRTGESEDIDKFSGKKFQVLKEYLRKHNLKGGFVRFDKLSEELCICREEFNDDISSEAWKILSQVWK